MFRRLASPVQLLALRGRLHLRQLSTPPLPSHSQGPTQPPLLNQTIGAAFRQIVSQAPAAPAVSSVHQQLHLTYQQLSDAVDTAARALIAAGVQRGDRVGILSPNKSVTPRHWHAITSRFPFASHVF
jgi:non-ribosomal peptide synthetase component F